MSFRLRYQAHDLELPVGEFVVGRSTECQLSLDDPLVSRRHAVLRVTADKVTAQDLGSRNGVLVNGTKIEGERELAPGDKVSIGSQDMVLQIADDSAPAVNREDHYRRATQTLGAAYVGDIREAIASGAVAGATDPPTTEASKSIQSFRLLGGVADKALAMGRAEEAERILQALLLDVLTKAREGQPIEATVAESSARYAARVAGATTKGSWVDYVFELYRLTKRPLPAPVVDELYTVVRRVKAIDLVGVRAYLSGLREMSASFGPTERFLMQRIEGLERLVALK
jgi:predicted component of type VI protein secretion system